MAFDAGTGIEAFDASNAVSTHATQHMTCCIEIHSAICAQLEWSTLTRTTFPFLCVISSHSRFWREKIRNRPKNRDLILMLDITCKFSRVEAIMHRIKVRNLPYPVCVFSLNSRLKAIFFIDLRCFSVFFPFTGGVSFVFAYWYHLCLFFYLLYLPTLLIKMIFLSCESCDICMKFILFRYKIWRQKLTKNL